jgi:hypothetical protein
MLVVVYNVVTNFTAREFTTYTARLIAGRFELR